MRVHWSNKALSQLADVAEGLRVHSEQAAAKVEDELIAALLSLARFPQRGRAVPESGLAEVREVFMGKYRLVYTAGDFLVEIVAVLHQRQGR